MNTNDTPAVILFGGVGVGKSTLLNHLAGIPTFPVAPPISPTSATMTPTPSSPLRRPTTKDLALHQTPTGLLVDTPPLDLATFRGQARQAISRALSLRRDLKLILVVQLQNDGVFRRMDLHIARAVATALRVAGTYAAFDIWVNKADDALQARMQDESFRNALGVAFDARTIGLRETPGVHVIQDVDLHMSERLWQRVQVTPCTRVQNPSKVYVRAELLASSEAEGTALARENEDGKQEEEGSKKRKWRRRNVGRDGGGGSGSGGGNGMFRRMSTRKLDTVAGISGLGVRQRRTTGSGAGMSLRKLWSAMEDTVGEVGESINEVVAEKDWGELMRK